MIFDKYTETTGFWRHTFKKFGLASIFDETTGFGTLYAKIIFCETTKLQSFGGIYVKIFAFPVFLTKLQKYGHRYIYASCKEF